MRPNACCHLNERREIPRYTDGVLVAPQRVLLRPRCGRQGGRIGRSPRASQRNCPNECRTQSANRRTNSRGHLRCPTPILRNCRTPSLGAAAHSNGVVLPLFLSFSLVATEGQESRASGPGTQQCPPERNDRTLARRSAADSE